MHSGRTREAVRYARSNRPPPSLHGGAFLPRTHRLQVDLQPKLHMEPEAVDRHWPSREPRISFREPNEMAWDLSVITHSTTREAELADNLSEGSRRGRRARKQ